MNEKETNNENNNDNNNEKEDFSLPNMPNALLQK